MCVCVGRGCSGTLDSLGGPNNLFSAHTCLIQLVVRAFALFLIGVVACCPSGLSPSLLGLACHHRNLDPLCIAALIDLATP